MDELMRRLHETGAQLASIRRWQEAGTAAPVEAPDVAPGDGDPNGG